MLGRESLKQKDSPRFRIPVQVGGGGDVVLADRGFLVKEEVVREGARLVVPALTRGKKQLSVQGAEEAPAISRIKIHVERAIGRIKDFQILRDTIPATLRHHATRIVVMCAVLTNMKGRLT